MKNKDMRRKMATSVASLSVISGVTLAMQPSQDLLVRAAANETAEGWNAAVPDAQSSSVKQEV